MPVNSAVELFLPAKSYRSSFASLRLCSIANGGLALFAFHTEAEPRYRQCLTLEKYQPQRQFGEVTPLTRTLLTLAIAGSGGAAAFQLGLPAALLSGSVLAVATAGLAGVRVGVPVWLHQIGFVVVGASLGSGVTPRTIELLPSWPLSLLALGACVTALMVVIPRYLHWVHNIDMATARLCAVPGALSYVLALAAESKVDVARVALLQSLRLASLIIFFPLVVELATGGLPAAQTAIAPATLADLALLLGLSALAGYGFLYLGVPAGTLVGALMASAVLHGAGAVSGVPVIWVLWPALIVTGSMIGSRFVGVDRRIFLSSLGAGAGSLAIASAISCAFSLPVIALMDIPFAQAWLALAPGGIETMTVLAFAMGYDPAFVAGHQLARFLGLSFILPILMARQGEPHSRAKRNAG